MCFYNGGDDEIFMIANCFLSLKFLSTLVMVGKGKWEFLITLLKS